jgi:isocitrate dehydrogenase (NAD+)
VVRENLEGLYMGHEHYMQIGDDPHAVAMSTGINTRAGLPAHLLTFAFDYAIATGRKKVTMVHKANIMKALTGIFLETAEQMYEEKYKGRIEIDTVIVDACAMKLVMNPWQFDVLVTTNLFGDILSDLRSPAWSAAWAWRPAPTSAPTRRSSRPCTARRPTSPAGHRQPDRADARRRMMLDHVATTTRLRACASRSTQTLNEDNVRTGDLGGKASTGEFTQALVARIRNS